MRSSGRVRETLWAAVTFADTTLSASATAVLTNRGNAGVLALRPFTVIRFRGNWLVTSDQAAAPERFVGNWGGCVVSDQADAIGVTAVPTPATDRGSDLWFMHESWVGFFNQLDGAAALQPANIDSKGMRKVEEGQNVVFVAEAGIGGSGCDVATVGRMLLKLH